MFVIGNRSVGKTYQFKDWALKSWLETGAQFCYVRRNKDELPMLSTLFKDIEDKYGLEIKKLGSTFMARKRLTEEEIANSEAFKALSERE
jgi:hypothetical protein